ncbi:hypothetical protein ACP4OV_014952 [Aristida adscensionis]
MTIIVGHDGGLATIQVDHTDGGVSYSGSNQEGRLIRSNKRKPLELAVEHTQGVSWVKLMRHLHQKLRSHGPQ